MNTETLKEQASLIELAEERLREALADWSDLPKDIYVIGAQRVDAVGFDIQCCSVPMVTAPEVRYVRADMISRPDAGGGVREALEKARKAIASLSRGSLGYAEFEDWDPPFSTHRYSIRDDLLREIDAALSAGGDEAKK